MGLSLYCVPCAYVLWWLFVVQRHFIVRKMARFLPIQFTHNFFFISKFLLLFEQTKHPFHYNIKYYVAKGRKTARDSSTGNMKSTETINLLLLAAEASLLLSFSPSNVICCTLRQIEKLTFIRGIDAQPKYWIKKN